MKASLIDYLLLKGLLLFQKYRYLKFVFLLQANYFININWYFLNKNINVVWTANDINL